MADVFNPWASPPNTGTLTGDLASFEINDMEDSEDAEEPEESSEENPIAAALKVITEQSQLIARLMKMLGPNSGGALDTLDSNSNSNSAPNSDSEEN